VDGAGKVKTDAPEFDTVEREVRDRIARLLSIKGKKSARHYHKEVGRIVWDHCGMARSKEGLETALKEIPALREEFWQNVSVPGSDDEYNPELERAGRVADFLEFAEVMCHDALMRDESCGGHFRVEHQTPEGEALRDDENFFFVGVWEHQGEGQPPKLNKEALHYEEVELAVRSYK